MSLIQKIEIELVTLPSRSSEALAQHQNKVIIYLSLSWVTALEPVRVITGKVLSTEVTVTSTVDEFVPSVALTFNVKLDVETSLSAFCSFYNPITRINCEAAVGIACRNTICNRLKAI